MRICRKCGTQIPDDNSFCSRCGERYIEYTPQPPYQPQPVRTTSTSSSAGGFLKVLPLIVSILGFIVAWESDWIFGLIVCIAATVYAYTRYKSYKSGLDMLSLIVSGGASALIIVLMISYS